MPPIDLPSDSALLPVSAAEHVGLVNSIPTQFGQVNADGLFPAQGLDTPFVRVDVIDGVITALPATPQGRPSTIAAHEPGRGVVFEIPNISHEDSVKAWDIRQWRALAARSRVPEEALINSIEQRHRRNRMKFDITLEVMKVSALKGLIIDGAATVLYDLYDLFGITQRIVYLDLDNEDADIPAAIESILGGTEDALVDEVMNGVEARVSPEMYSKIIGHPSLTKYFLGTPFALDLLNQRRDQQANAYRRSITIAGLVIKEYRAMVRLWGATSATRLLSANEGYASPVGTVDTHQTYVAPPLDVRELEGGGAAGVDDLIHMTEEVLKHGDGLEWKYQANALPIWKRPNLLTKLDAGEAP